MTCLLALLLLYAVYCVLLFFSQTKLIFPAGMAGKPSEHLPTPNTQAIWLDTNQGQTRAWFIPAPNASAQSPAPLAMFFHGNAELIDHQHAIIDLYHRIGISVLMVEYRGYGTSQGTPSERHIVEDSLAVLEQVRTRDDVDPHGLILHGRSIGGGLATQVALQLEGYDKPQALIVQSTFTSISGMAMRYGVPPFLITSPLRSEEAFKALDLPILIMHGNLDTIIPVSHAHRLHHAASDSELVLFDTDHNIWPPPKEAWLYEEKIQAHIQRSGNNRTGGQ